MAKITDYTTLQSELKDEVDRSDDTDTPWTRLIQFAEARLNRDRRCRRVVTNTAFTVSAEATTLPANFAEAVGLSHNGTTYYHKLNTVSAEMMPRLKARHGTPGVPVSAMFVNKTTVYVTPVPDQTYTLWLTYYEGVPSLGGTTQSNWLLDRHPDIYLTACVVEYAAYMRDEKKFIESMQVMDRKLEELHRDEQRSTYGGSLVRQPTNAMA